MQCIVVKSDEFENSSPVIYFIFSLNPDYVAARYLRSLRCKNVCYELNQLAVATRPLNPLKDRFKSECDI